MKRIHPALSLLLVCAAFLLHNADLPAQNKQQQIPVNSRGDTSYMFRWCRTNAQQIGLPDLITATDSLHIRFSTSTQVVDIWTADYKTFNGSISAFLEEYKSQKPGSERQPKTKFYSEIKPLDTAIARAAYNWFVTFSILEIPDQDSIADWSDGFDGSTYMIETSTRAKYTFKSYWTPAIFPHIEQAVAIDSLVRALHRELQMEAAFDSFLKTLPYGCYRMDGWIVICRFKEKKAKKRHRERGE